MISTPESLTTLPAYHQARDALLVCERQIRFGHGIASPKELRANEVVQKLRDKERETVWHHEVAGRDVFEGMPWRFSKELVESTEVFELLRKMPKGAYLHAHMDAICNPSTLARLALAYPNIHMQSSRALTPEFLDQELHHPETDAATIVFRALPEGEFVTSLPSGKGIHEANYAGEWLQASLIREKWPGGSEVFDQWLRDQLMITPMYKTPDAISVRKIWRKFESTFRVARGLLSYEPVLEQYFGELFQECAEDGISWVEPRLLFFDWLWTAKDGSETLGHTEWVKIFVRSLENFKKADPSRPFGAKLIYSTLRHMPAGEGTEENKGLRWWLRDCLELKTQFPNVICGFDLVGHEDSGRTLLYYIDDFMWFKEEQRRAGFEIPFMFHAGETLADGDATDLNLVDAILLGTKRIGHGFSLVKHPKLMQLVKERNICIESCPISNEMLRYTDSMCTHPLPILLNHGVPVALSSDDPSVFGNSGITHEFYQALVASHNMTLSGLGELARKSIEHSSMDFNERSHLSKSFEQSWDAFLDAVLEK